MKQKRSQLHTIIYIDTLDNIFIIFTSSTVLSACILLITAVSNKKLLIADSPRLGTGGARTLTA
jgi:hypothetical protein